MSMQKPMVAAVLLTGNGELAGNRMVHLRALYHARVIAGVFRLNVADNQGPVLQHLSTLSHCSVTVRTAAFLPMIILKSTVNSENTSIFETRVHTRPSVLSKVTDFSRN